MKKLYQIFWFCFPLAIQAQLNITVSSPAAEQVMLGNYDPASYAAPTVIEQADSVSRYIHEHISPDSLKSYIIQLSTFHNRNTGADTVSNTTGIGAARRWVFGKFQEFSQQQNGRLIPSYLGFDLNICSITHHKDIFAVLPGKDTSDPSLIIIEGHIDSRCEGECDILCQAQGVEDNASGTALVMELARVMSALTFDHTIVFLVTIGEEQGLLGAEAFADYTGFNDIKVKAVQNNDVVGGITCGETSSPPSCPGEGNIDSLQVRLFSFGSFNSRSKQLARFSKLEYKEQLLPWVTTPMTLTIMSAEDRTGRGGDHIPFRQKGYASIRFCSANEHGDANVTDPNYHDRQHTTRDTLGMDTDGDMIIDSFFVDFHYLARNAVINGNAAAMAATGPDAPGISAFENNALLEVHIHPPYPTPAYRVAIRTSTNDWDTVYYVTDTIQQFPVPLGGTYCVSAATVDSEDVESLFSIEVQTQVTSVTEESAGKGLELMQNRPNPFDEATYISVMVNEPVSLGTGRIEVRDLQGRIVSELPVSLAPGMNEVLFIHGFQQTGLYIYSLIVDGKIIDSKEMVFAN